LGPPKPTLRASLSQPYGFSGRFVRWMHSHAEKYDAVIVEGVWQFIGLGTCLALRGKTTPYFVCTHGMLDPWFRHEYLLKHLKKWLYWLLVEYRVLRDARAVLYFGESERERAHKSFWPWPYQAKAAFAGVAVGVPSGDPRHQRHVFLRKFPQLRNKRLLLFLGRIHPVKGCDLLIEAFAKVSRVDPSLHLVFAGSDQVGWQRELQKRVVELGLQSGVTWTGMLTGDIKWGALHSAEALVLPSHTEGFPIAVIESMACGVPVLISNKVSIWSEIQATGGAFVARDDLEGTTELLDSWVRLTPDERKSMRLRAVEGYTRRFARSVVLKRFISMLRDLGVKEASEQ
jgi:glycosyltransferase involved in cell wall biosynthesis